MPTRYIHTRSIVVGIFLGMMIALPIGFVASQGIGSRGDQARLNNALSWTLGDLNDRLNDAEFRLSSSLQSPQDVRNFQDANLSVTGAAKVLQNVMSGIPLEPEYRSEWDNMSDALFRAANELELLRSKVTANETPSDQDMARVQEMIQLVAAIRNAVAGSEIRGEQGVRFDSNAINEAVNAADSY